MYKFSFIFFTAFLIVSFACDSGFAQARKKEKITVFEVPTTGKIIDVQYRPEFDEWWVKCREGNDIVIYSYEKLTRKWGRVLFTTKKPDEKGKQTEGMQESGIGHPPGETGVGAPKEEKKGDSGKTEGPKKQTDTSQKKGSQQKWWDP